MVRDVIRGILIDVLAFLLNVEKGGPIRNGVP